MHRIFILAFSIIISFTACNENSEAQNQENDNTIVLSGRVNYPQPGLIILEQLMVRESKPVDTLELKEDNTFEAEINLETPGYYRLNFFRKQGVNLILDNDDVFIVADGNAPNGFVDISGSNALDALKEFNQSIQAEYGQKENQLNQKYVNARNSGDQQTMQDVQDDYMELMDEKIEYTKDFIRNQGASLLNVQLISQLDNDKQFAFKDSVVTVLADTYPNEPNVQNLKEQMDKLRRLAPGNPAPEISLPNPEGEIVTLSSFRGKVVLVDFWAQWCKPCRMENPNIVNAYNKYHDKGFDILGVSLDRTREKWLQAIREDGLVWNQVSDLKYWNSEAAKTYNITAIPFSILVNEEGIIIAKNLRGKALHDKLEEVFSGE